MNHNPFATTFPISNNLFDAVSDNTLLSGFLQIILYISLYVSKIFLKPKFITENMPHSIYVHDLQAYCVEFIILEGDNLTSLFPGVSLHLGGLNMDSVHLFAILSAVIMALTLLVKNARVISYLSGTVNRSVKIGGLGKIFKH